MDNDADTDSKELTLAFSLSAIDRLEDPKAVFEDAKNWSQSIGLIDSDTERIEQIVSTYDLQQDFDILGRDKWFALEEISETTSTPRHVYVGASDEDMRVSTLFAWEYIRVSEAAENADWNVCEPHSDPGIVARLLAAVGGLID